MYSDKRSFGGFAKSESHGGKPGGKGKSKGAKKRSVSFVEEETSKRHRTRGALSKRQLQPETILYFKHPEEENGEDFDFEDSEEEDVGDQASMSSKSSSVQNIEIPTIKELTDQELAEIVEDDVEGEDEDVELDDEYYKKLHLVFEIKEQAIREQWMKGGNSRRMLRKMGPVSSTELLLAPAVEAKLSREDTMEVLGKSDLPDVPEERLRDIQGRLDEVEKTYERDGKYARFWLHTQWKPEIVVEKRASDDGDNRSDNNNNNDNGGEPPKPKPRLVLKLKRLQDNWGK